MNAESPLPADQLDRRQLLRGAVVAAKTIEQFVQELDFYIRWYNEKRIKISLGSLSPFEYRESLGIAALTSPIFCRVPIFSFS